MYRLLSKHFLKIMMIPALGAVSILVVTYYFLTQAELNTAYANLVGNQYNGLEKLTDKAQSVLQGHQAQDQKDLQQLINQFDKHQDLFHHGGYFMRVRLTPVAGELLVKISEVTQIWQVLRKSYIQIAEDLMHDDQRQTVLSTLTEQYSLMKNRLRPVFHLLQNQQLAMHKGLLWFLFLVEISSIGLLVLGLRFARRHLNQKGLSEKALQVSEDRFNRIVRATHDGIWYWDVDSGQIYFSPRWNEMLGYEPTESQRDFMFFQSKIHPDDLGHVLDEWIQCIDGELRSFYIEYRVKNSQESYVWLRSRGRALRDNDQTRGYQLIGADTDLSDQRQMEMNLNRVVIQLQHTLDNSPTIIYRASTDNNFVINFVSENMYRVMGFTSKEVLGNAQFWSSHIHPDDRNVVIEKLKSLEQDVQQVHEYRFKNAQNQYCWIHDSMRLIFDEQNDTSEIIGSMMDMTKRKEMEHALRKEKEEQKGLVKKLQNAQEQLLQSEKMASIGQLAAGVAHEINNPVGFVSSNLGSLKNYVDNLIEMIQLYVVLEPLYFGNQPVLDLLESAKNKLDLAYIQDDAKSLIEESLDGVARVKRIVSDLKNFSHVDDTNMQWADLEKGFESTLNIVWNELKYKVEIVREFAVIPQVECAIAQLNQVFMNLLVNAGYAIKEKGKITIRTGFGEPGWVWIEIQDSGEGIDAAHLRRIFDPFFTTKPVGKGTGLGLSLSFGIVEKHGGRIDVSSEPGKGSVFRVHLPIEQASRYETKIPQDIVVEVP